MSTLLIATSNQAKLLEMKSICENYFTKQVHFLGLSDLPPHVSPLEDGKTFEENAIKKAKHYAIHAQLPTLADDGGLMIDELSGEPGVMSRRWPGYEATDRELIDLALTKLKDVPPPRRTARLGACICFYHPKRNICLTEEAHIDGSIALNPSTYETNGYPFRAIFIVKKFNKMYDGLSQQEHEVINHRVKALRKLIVKIETKNLV